MKDRRSFLKSSSMALAGLGLGSLVSFESLAEAKKFIGANGKINVGAVGINGMGWADVTSLMKIPEVQIVALCDVDENVLNFGLWPTSFDSDMSLSNKVSA